jgi:hypothetical protein
MGSELRPALPRMGCALVIDSGSVSAGVCCHEGIGECLVLKRKALFHMPKGSLPPDVACWA